MYYWLLHMHVICLKHFKIKNKNLVLKYQNGKWRCDQTISLYQFSIKKKKKIAFLWSFPLQHNIPPVHPQKSSDWRLDTSTTLKCKSNLWKIEWVFSSSFVVYHTCFFLISKDNTTAALSWKINTFPPHVFPKVSFLHCYSLAHT